MTSGSFIKAARQPVIYDGFGAGIDALNQQIVKESRFMRAFAGGRGYAKPGPRQPNLKPNVYCSVIHAMSYAENEPDDVLNALSANRGDGGGLYMGAAGLLNLSFMAALRSGGGILFDVNPTQTWFWQLVLPMLPDAKNGDDFMDTLVDQTEYIQSNVARLYRLSGEDGLIGAKLRSGMPPENYMMYAYLSSPLDDWRRFKGHGFLRWIEDEEGFKHIQSMAKHKAIGALTLDVLDKAGWKQLAGYLASGPEAVPKKVQTIYMSNILTFLKERTLDFTFRLDPDSKPAHAHEAVSQVLTEKPSIITELADPSMTWPKSTDPKFCNRFTSYAPTVSYG